MLLNAVGLLQMFCDAKGRGNPWHLKITCACQDASCIKTLTLHPNHHLQILFQLCCRNCASTLSGQMEIIMPWLNSATMSWRIFLYKTSSYLHHVSPNHLTCLAVSKEHFTNLSFWLLNYTIKVQFKCRANSTTFNFIWFIVSWHLLNV